MLIFTDSPSPKVYGLYTRENVDIYGRPQSDNIDIWLYYIIGEGNNSIVSFL